METMTRRRFVALGVAAAAACASCPNARSAPGRTAPPRTIAPTDVGPLSSYSADGVTDTWAKSHNFLLVRRDGRLYATVATCTHEKFTLQADTKDKMRIYCAKDKAYFDAQGNPITRQPKRPLSRLAIRMDDKGHVLVDPARRFAKDQWGDPAAFLALEPPRP